MSYIPKYILKRMIPKDAVKLIGDNLEITMVNVISPISIDEVPDDLLNYLELKVDNEVVMGAGNEGVGSGLQIKAEGKVFTLKNVKEAVGLTLPVGGTLTVVMPNVKKLEKGSTHSFEVTIKTNNPVNVQFEREVC
jgi:hypothetical protein